jgi:hypothetical protein
MTNASELEKGVNELEISPVPSNVKIVSIKVGDYYIRQKKLNLIEVSWDSPSDPTNPLNWSQKAKWATAILTSLGGLVTLMSGAMLAPGLAVIGHDLRISEAEASLALSIYILAFAFGPMLLAPLSEVFGRRPIWIGGSAWYVLWNTLCGISNNRGLMIVGRFMSGLGASAEFAVSTCSSIVPYLRLLLKS